MLLEKIDEDIKTQVVATRWLGYLLQYTDHKNLEKLFQYYESIGWISPEVRDKLIKLSQGIKSNGKSNWLLPPRMHITSLLFISNLAGINIKNLTGINAYLNMYVEHPEEFLSI